jgi:hypothetical protein
MISEAEPSLTGKKSREKRTSRDTGVTCISKKMLTRKLRKVGLGYGRAVYFDCEYCWMIGKYRSVHISDICEWRQSAGTLLNGRAIGIHGYRSMRRTANIQCRKIRDIPGRSDSDSKG